VRTTAKEWAMTPIANRLIVLVLATGLSTLMLGHTVVA
jgi:hypothetical protein